MKYISYLFLFLLLSACRSPEEVRLEQALDFAGSNRSELEKVFEHYSNDPEKLEAARFLVRNMPHWYSYKGCELDSLNRLLATEVMPQEGIDKWKNFPFYSLPKVYDAHVITSDYLIENIDLAFDEWKNKTWNKTLGFDDFCEYILPYRIADEPLSSWRRLYHDYYTSVLDSAYQGSDVIEACKAINRKLLEQGYRFNTTFSTPHRAGTFLFYHRRGYCREVCDFTMYALRACGIPVATDFIIYAPDYQSSHSWSAVRDTTGQFIPFFYDELVASRKKGGTDGRKKGKVYRYRFGERRDIDKEIETDAKIPFLFRNRYVEDATGYYWKNEVTIPLQAKGGKYVYLGIFSPDGWIPIDMALREGNKAVFHNLGPDIIYQVFYLDGKKQTPAGYPFIYTKGKAETLKPDFNRMEGALLKRKMSLKQTVAVRLYQAVLGAKIEASQDASFSRPDLLYQFNDTLWGNYFELPVLTKGRKYRYLRYVVLPEKRMELAGFSVYEDSLCKQPITLRRMNDIEPINELDRITDHDVLTAFLATDTSCNTLVYDLGKATPINRIVFSPRNDDNYIWPGDVYELFYHDGVNGWQSLGRQTATGHELKCRVPYNALFWLRNLTKGREEQVFIIRNGKQVFTYDLK